MLISNTAKQIEAFIQSLERYNDKLPSQVQRGSEDYTYLRYFFPAFVNDRNKRASEIHNPKYQEIVQLANKQLPLPTYTVMCMDGRVKLIHVVGFGAGIGSSMRVPGALLKEFIRSSEGTLRLESTSNFAQLLDKAFIKNEAIAEIFDSHYGCAARKGEEAARGRNPADAGLFSDVMHKKEFVSATKQYVKKYHPGKYIALIQTSFNPYTGYLYMGLEKKGAIEFAKKKAGRSSLPEFSKPILKELVMQGIVISTGNLVSNKKIQSIFEKNFFSVNWKHNYIASSRNFWNAITRMKSVIYPVLKKELLKSYPELSAATVQNKKEIEERALILLCNSFNGYLHNKDHNELNYLDIDDHEYEGQKHYQYDTHNEEGIKVSEGGHPPYDIAMFVIFGGDLLNVPANIELASGIVRDNRAKTRVTDASKSYKTTEQFVRGPVPVVMQQIVREKMLTNKDWKTLEEIDWSDLQTIAWQEMSDVEFSTYLQGKGNLPLALANAINTLRKRMVVVYDPSSPTSTHLLDQYKVILPVVCDEDRVTHAVIPFLKLGF